jgi:hypothetical protein
MKIAATAIAFLTLLAGAGADVRTEVKALYAKADTQLAAKSFSGFASLLRSHLAPGFTSMSNGKKSNFDEMMSDIKGGVARIKKVTACRTTLVQIAVSKTTASFKTERFLGWTSVPTAGKTHKMLLVQPATDTWILLHGAWKLKSIEWSANSKLTIDGKPS